MTCYYEIEIQYQETTHGKAQIIAPSVLNKKNWHYVAVNEIQSKDIIQVDADASEHEIISLDSTIQLLNLTEAKTVKNSYPAPKIKQHNIGSINKTVQVDNLAINKTKAKYRDYQTVRWKFFLIDVPVKEI